MNWFVILLRTAVSNSALVAVCAIVGRASLVREEWVATDVEKRTILDPVLL